MATKYLFLFMIICLSNWAFRCGEEQVQVCGDNILRFDLQVLISPLQDTFKIGDTIWIEMSVPNELTDQISNEMITVKSYDFKVVQGLYRLESSDYPGAFFEFERIETVGTYIPANSNGALFRMITEVADEKQRFLVGLKPRFSGLFQIDFFNFNADLKCQPLPALGKELNTLEITYTMNNGDLEENNYPMLLASPIAAMNPELIATPEQFLKAGVYIFQVVE